MTLIGSPTLFDKEPFFLEGGRGIRTPAGFDTPFGFQDRPLQPDLGIPPKNK